MSQPLAGVCVLDFSTLLPGPLATLLLAEAGGGKAAILGYPALGENNDLIEERGAA